MSGLELHLFGSPYLRSDGVRIALNRRKALALLAYLALTPGTRSRDALAELLWPERDAPTSRSDLRSAIFSLQRAIGHQWLDLDGEDVVLRRDPSLSVDVGHFRSLVERAFAHAHPPKAWCAACATALTEAVELYCGDFMAGFTLRDAPEFDNWQSYQAESLRLALIAALERLVQLEAERGDFEAAIRHARRWLEQDPLCEEPHRALMQLHAQTGNRAAALRQYDECVRILDEELGIPPDVETTALRDAIAGGEVKAHTATQHPPPLKLPPDRTPFIGREVELATIAERLADPACHLLTVLGPGGSGKTRLAVQAARAQAGRFDGGVFFVDLQPVEAPELLAAAILRALAVPASGTGDAADQLVAYLIDQEMLVLLDNFEHLVDAVGLLSRLLDAAPGLKLLVTSRVRLNLVRECLLPLEGLDLPPETAAHAALSDFSATGLFLACTTRLRPRYRPAPHEATDVTRICRLLEGMPLGIELAAARTQVLPVSEIAAELVHGLDVLATTLRDVPERHRSMAAAFDTSWRLLSPRERSILGCTSVFRGGFTREAAAAVTGATAQDLEGLADACWLYVESGGRYGMHEMIRQFCAKKLDVEPLNVTVEGEGEVHDRHARHYHTFFLAKLRALDVNEKVIEQVEQDFDNLTTAWERLAEISDFEAVCDMAWGFLEVVDRLACWHLARPVVERSIRHLEPTDLPSTAISGSRLRQRDLTLASLWLLYGWWEDMRGRRDEAKACYDRAEKLIGKDDLDDRGWALAFLMLEGNRAVWEYMVGDFAGSKASYLRILNCLQQAGTPPWPCPTHSSLNLQTTAYYMLCVNAMALGEYIESREWAGRSVAINESCGFDAHQAYTLGALVYPLIAIGDYFGAEQRAKEGLRAATRSKNSHQTANLLYDLARLYLEWGKPEQARVWGRRGVRLSGVTGNVDALHPALCWLAAAELALENKPEAWRLCNKSLHLCDQSGVSPDIHYTRATLGLAQIALAEGQLDAAAMWLHRALASPAKTVDEMIRGVQLAAQIRRSWHDAQAAAEWLAFVAKSPLSWYSARQKALAALRELESELPAEIYKAAVARGEVRSLDDVIAEILAEGGAASPAPPEPHRQPTTPVL
jgi:DNA-binding SARP family transcriptional activator